MSIERLLDDYELDVKSQGGSGVTVDIKRLALKLFARHLGGIPDVRQIAAQDFKGWLIHLQTKPGSRGKMLSKTAVNTYSRSVKAFWRWLRETHRIKRDPISGVKLPPPANPETLPRKSHGPEEINRILDMAGKQGWNLREPVILELIWDTGIAAQQLSDLTLDNVDWQTGVIEAYRTKNRSLPPMVANRLTLERLQHYVKHERPDVPLERHVFLTKDGRPMTSRRVCQQLRRLGAKAGLSRPLGPHSVRHEFASDALPFGTLEEVQDMMGHVSRNTTKAYARPRLRYRAHVHDRVSPVLTHRYRPRQAAGRPIKPPRAELRRTQTHVSPSPASLGTDHGLSGSHGRRIPADGPLGESRAGELLDGAIDATVNGGVPGGRTVVLMPESPRSREVRDMMDKAFGPRIR